AASGERMDERDQGARQLVVTDGWKNLLVAIQDESPGVKYSGSSGGAGTIIGAIGDSSSSSSATAAVTAALLASGASSSASTPMSRSTTATSSSSAGRIGTSIRAISPPPEIQCRMCTLLNPGTNTECDVCGLPLRD